MLVELKIKNFAIINELELEFKPGLVVFTGETGAGKSIIMGALSMLFGTRADMTDLRSGADWASVEAIFRIPDKVREVVDSLLVEEALSGGEEYLTLGRELRRDKQNVARVNGHRVSVSILVELGRYLIDIHGQSDHLSLMQVHQHKGLLDRYANVGKILKSYQETYQELQKVQRELDGLQKVEQDAARRSELLSYQLDEIEAANLVVGEDDELKYEHKRLANSEKLAELCQATLVILDDAPPDQPTVMELLGQTVSDIKNLASIDPSQASLDEKIQGLTEEIAEFGQDLRTYMETLEFDPAQLKKVEERLNLIRSLKRKYGQTIPEILEFAEKASVELETYVNSSTRIAELEILENKLLIELGQKGQRLTQQRKTGAEKMAAALEVELKDLRMEQARFRVDFSHSPNSDGVPVGEGRRLAYTRHGLEEIEFLIETNPGEGFKPLARVASGGETSRLMLALKQVLVKADSIFTLVFDEIDQGIGGRVGAIVGYKLRKLATQHQVICITHLPQLAGFGGQHLHVQKRIENGRTLTQVQPLTGEERVNELAQMLGGISEANKKSAQDILESSNQLIKSL